MGAAVYKTKKFHKIQKFQNLIFFKFSGTEFHCDSWMSFKDLDFLLGSVVTFLKQ